MTTLNDLLDDVREQIEANDDALNEARERLAFVRDKASSFYGTLRTYRSGSLAAHTMNQPVTDGDGGLVLNRNYYPGLGPEGTGNEAPADVVAELVAHLGPLVREAYPDAKVHQSKRGPKIHFHAPTIDGDDPTVDLVLALTRKEGNGIWIPNLNEDEDDDWEASDPEQHIVLFNDGASAFRSTRAESHAACEGVEQAVQCPRCLLVRNVCMGVGVCRAWHGGRERASRGVRRGSIAAGGWDPTPDPAEVSPDLRLLINAETMAVRLRAAAGHMQDAMDSDDEGEIRAAVNGVFWKYIDAPASASLSAAAMLLKKKTPVAAATLGVAVAATTAGASVARAYGGRGA